MMTSLRSGHIIGGGLENLGGGLRLVGSDLGSEFTQQDGRKKRTVKCCVTNVTGLLLVCFVVIFT